MIWEPALERLQTERLRQSVRRCLERVPFYRDTHLRAGLAIATDVRVVPPKTIPRSEGKATRVVEATGPGRA